MSANTRPDDRIINPAQAVMLDQAAGNKQRAQEIARRLIRENGELLKVLGALLERTGPVELDKALLADAGVLFQVERYDSTDGLSIRWVGKRVAG